MQKIDTAQNGVLNIGRSGNIAPHTIDTKPLATAVLCKQLPTRIHRAVSSPNRCGSIIIYFAFASSAFSSSFSNVSVSSPSYTSRITCVVVDLSSLQKSKIIYLKQFGKDVGFLGKLMILPIELGKMVQKRTNEKMNKKHLELNKNRTKWKFKISHAIT